ncbi:MAG: L,D-transpeptidase [Myxococcota bacterium]
MTRRSVSVSSACAALLLAFGCDDGSRSTAEAPPAAATAAPEAASDAEPDPVVDEDAAGEQAVASPPDAGVVADAPPAPKVKPEDYGTLHPPTPAPAEDDLTVHAIAGFPVVTVYAEPNLESPRLGHMRLGQRTMVTTSVPDEGEGCKKGFHALPTGGYACASKGLLVDAEKEPYMHLPPPAPRVDQPHPYDYVAVARDGTAMWWRPADADERMLADEKYQSTLPVEERKEVKKPSASGDAKSGDVEKKDDDAALPGVLDDAPETAAELTEAEKAEIERKKAEAAARAEARRKAEEERAAELARKAARLPLTPGTPFMAKGNILSVGQKTRDKGRTWLHTARGGYVESNKTYGKKVYDFEGAVLEEGADFPFGFVMSEKAVAYELKEDGSFKWKRKLQYREFVDLEPETKSVGDKTYYQTTEGLWVRESQIRLAERRDMPKGVDPWERWVDVSLSKQLLVAYEGTTPVFTTLVSTGKKGTAEESFRTPKGTWRIQSKHISSSMAGSTASDGDYSIQDVPWTMFFEGNYALHGAFWHQRFGRTRSHGCVNLGPTDARWLFYWTTPFLPETWHGVKSQEDAPGSMVVVRE